MIIQISNIAYTLGSSVILIKIGENDIIPDCYEWMG